MDALFGLPRRKAAGTSYRQALHGSLFFQDQGDVDKFVKSAPKNKQTKAEKVQINNEYIYKDAFINILYRNAVVF